MLVLGRVKSIKTATQYLHCRDFPVFSMRRRSIAQDQRDAIENDEKTLQNKQGRKESSW